MFIRLDNVRTTPDNPRMRSFKISIATEESDHARTLTGALSEFVTPAPDAITQFEAGTGWVIEAYYGEVPDLASLRQQLNSFANFEIPEIVRVDVPDENWVAISQAALPPVSAGRFTIHGSHDRDRVPRGPNTLLIDAGEAFGTAHHATTQGCLLAIDRMTRQHAFSRVLDLGCGSGVLAIATARALPHAHISASDNDPLAIAVARSNAELNSVAGRIHFSVAHGMPGRKPVRRHRYDLIVANILADPLIGLAGDISEALVPGGILVLSGILNRQAADVSAAYRCRGVSLLNHQRLAGWSILTLIKRDGRGPRDRTTPAA
jgi:ribosomal protein L11 methyltransferase